MVDTNLSHLWLHVPMESDQEEQEFAKRKKCFFVIAWCQDGNTSSRTITEVKERSSTSFRYDTAFCGVGCAAVDQPACQTSMVAQGDGR